MHRFIRLLLLAACLFLLIPVTLDAAGGDSYGRRMWWDDEPVLDDRPRGWWRNGFYGTLGATGNQLGWDIAGGFRFPGSFYFGLGLEIETGGWHQSLYDEGYYRPLPFGPILGREFPVQGDAQLDVELYLAQDFSWRVLPHDGNGVWTIQPTIRYGLPVVLASPNWGTGRGIRTTTNTIYLFAGPRFRPYGTDLVVGLALR